MIEDWSDAEDRLLARSVFCTDDLKTIEGLILDWTAQHGFGHGRISGIELSIGAAVTIILANDSKMFVKVWSGDAEAGSLSAQMKVQNMMAAQGFPAPAVLTELSSLGPGWAVAMEYNRNGVPTDARIPGVRRAMAVGLVRFVAMAEACRGLQGLPRKPLPPERGIWPKPHNALFDFEATKSGAEWIDELAGAALSTMRSATSRVVLGHNHRRAKNMRMGRDEIAVIYDWDAVFLDRETFVLGSAAAHFPVTWELDVPETPAPSEVAAFIRDYQEARGAFKPAELVEIEAAVTYARAYKARCEHAIDPEAAHERGSSRESLKLNGPFCLDRA